MRQNIIIYEYKIGAENKCKNYENHTNNNSRNMKCLLNHDNNRCKYTQINVFFFGYR